MFGWLFNTLQHRLNAEEKEWRSLNKIRGELRPNLVHNLVLRFASMPMPVTFIIFFIVFLFSLFFAFVSPKNWVVLYVSKLNIHEPIAYFTALWSTQAAIAALVYPIVIAFVTLLLERRNNSKATLHIYLHDSASLLAGLS